MKGEEKKQFDTKVAKLYAIGYTTIQIAEKMNCSNNMILNSRARLGRTLQENAGTVWVTFLLQYQQQYQLALEAYQRVSSSSKPHMPALVGSIKLMAELTTNMFEFAKDLGFVKVVPQELKIDLTEHAKSWEELFNFKGINSTQLTKPESINNLVSRS